jgi:proprotein convertase subtilisin/kexin type 5
MSVVGGQLYLFGSSCVFNCPVGTYQNTTLNECKTCDVSCATCNGPTNANCYKCANATVAGSLVVYYLAFATSVCSLTCPQGQYIDAAVPNYCQQCGSPCAACAATATTCLACPNGFYFYPSTCLTTCPQGTYGDALLAQCLSCNAACATCFGAGTSSCNSCKTDSGTGVVYYLAVGITKCVAACPAGQIQGSAHLCVACSQQCSAC